MLTGSRRVARRAGQKHAFNDTTIISSAMAPSVIGVAHARLHQHRLQQPADA